jgi:hypothetical protein
VWIALVTTTARADGVDDLVAKGQELARQSQWTLAIAAFKQADAQRPRALHACMIGLAYTRRELWPQAELFFAKCRARATAGDREPEWMPEAERQLASKLIAANVAPVAIAVDPANARITVSSFEPDETFSPGTIHLAPGRHVLEISAPGHEPQTRELVVVGAQPQAIAVRLTPLIWRPSRGLVWTTLGLGVAFAAAGTAFDIAEVQPLRKELGNSQLAYAAHAAAFDRWRVVTVGAWAAGALALGTGTWLAIRRSTVVVSVELDRGGGAIALGWRR